MLQGQLLLVQLLLGLLLLEQLLLGLDLTLALVLGTSPGQMRVPSTRLWGIQSPQLLRCPPLLRRIVWKPLVPSQTLAYSRPLHKAPFERRAQPQRPRPLLQVAQRGQCAQCMRHSRYSEGPKLACCLISMRLQEPRCLLLPQTRAWRPVSPRREAGRLQR